LPTVARQQHNGNVSDMFQNYVVRCSTFRQLHCVGHQPRGVLSAPDRCGKS
jgi:hypothetical protein